jgi:hypothetical protein
MARGLFCRPSPGPRAAGQARGGRSFDLRDHDTEDLPVCRCGACLGRRPWPSGRLCAVQDAGCRVAGYRYMLAYNWTCRPSGRRRPPPLLPLLQALERPFFTRAAAARSRLDGSIPTAALARSSRLGQERSRRGPDPKGLRRRWRKSPCIAAASLPCKRGDRAGARCLAGPPAAARGAASHVPYSRRPPRRIPLAASMRAHVCKCACVCVYV